MHKIGHKIDWTRSSEVERIAAFGKAGPMQHISDKPQKTRELGLFSDEKTLATPPTQRATEPLQRTWPESLKGFSTFTSPQLSTLAAQLLIRSASVEDPSRAGLVRTPERFSKAFKHLLSGYDQTAQQVVGEGIFPSESSGVVSINNVEFYSLCEHHMLPFWGNVSVAYYPNGKIIGLSKIPRLVDLYSRRLQVQESLTQQIASAMSEILEPRAVVVRIQGQHLCMMMRGVEKQNSSTISESNIGLETLSALEQQRIFAAIGS
ncbi:MAG: GTP cyclohydrolase I FolE [Proteobacteria bacterium]|nr:GTP cyclohydrolase I FolE [Pseudomonadota bacterium]